MSPRIGRPTDNPKRHETRIRMSDEDVEILDYCSKIAGKSKAEVIREGIRKVYTELEKSNTEWLKQEEELEMKLVQNITCPYCGKSLGVDVKQYASEKKGSEKGMGTETEYTFDCEDFSCPECKESFRIEGTVFEYPEGEIEISTIQGIKSDEK